MEELQQLTEDAWFRLGDRDLAVHVSRTSALRAGRGLEEITRDLCRRFGLRSQILPMSEQPVRTLVQTDEGELAFQDYFVHRRCNPVITELRYKGSEKAELAPAVREALMHPGLAGIVICPSNPFLSIAPMLSIPGMRRALGDAAAPVVAVSPIVGGSALKGPTAKIMRELGLETSAAAVARHYGDLLDGFVLDIRDRELAGEIASLGMEVEVTDTIMSSGEKRNALARTVVQFIDRLRPPRRATTESTYR